MMMSKRSLAGVLALALAGGLGLTACSSRSSASSGAHASPAGWFGLSPAELAKPASCYGQHLGKWGTATCRSYSALSSQQRRYLAPPTSGGVVRSVTIQPNGTAVVEWCIRVDVTPTGHYQHAFPGDEWLAITVSNVTTTGPTNAGVHVAKGEFSCAGL
jgi:hypothetical protein